MSSSQKKFILKGSVKDVLREWFSYNIPVSGHLGIKIGSGVQSITLDIASSDRGFVNVGGMCVNVDNMDIALGINPNKEEYVKVSNLRELLGDVLSNESLRCYIEDLKIGFKSLDIKDYKQGKDYVPEGASVVLNCARMHRFKNESTTSGVPFSTETILSTLEGMRACLEDLSHKMFQNFIVEGSIKESFSTNKFYNGPDFASTFNGLRRARICNLNCLYVRYIQGGLPVSFISGVMSYGFAHNRLRFRNSICDLEDGTLKGRRCVDSLIYSEGALGASTSDIMKESFSSYLSKLGYGKICVYNFIDLLRAVGKEQQVLFAAEVAQKYSNYVLVDKLVNNFGIVELRELGVSKKDFTQYVLEYFNRTSYLVDWGATYTRNVRISQNSLLCFSDKMLVNSGKVWDQVSDRIMKGFESSKV